MLYVRSCWIPTLCVVKTTLVHQLPTLHGMCAFTLYRDKVFSYLHCSWIVRECFEPRISFITCSNNIWQPFFALLKNCYAWTIAVFTTNHSNICRGTTLRTSFLSAKGRIQGVNKVFHVLEYKPLYYLLQICNARTRFIIQLTPYWACTE